MNTPQPKKRHYFIKVEPSTHRALRRYVTRIGAKIGKTADIAIAAHIARQSQQTN